MNKNEILSKKLKGFFYFWIMEYYEIVERFVIMMIAVLAIFIFSNKKRNIKLHPLVLLVSVCTFFLCLVFTKINMSVGIGFGLFAIFSILRFRTETFSIHTTIFLFVSITLSILNTLLPIEKMGNLMVINLVIVLSNILMNFLDKQDFSTEKKSLEIITTSDEFLRLNDNEKTDFVKLKTNFSNFSYQIKSIDLREDKVIVKVYY